MKAILGRKGCAERCPCRRGAVVAGLLVALALMAALAIGAQVDRTQLWEDREVYAGWRVQHHVLSGSCRLLDREQALRMSARRGECSVLR